MSDDHFGRPLPKVVQISSAEGGLYALTDDGRVFVMSWGLDGGSWEELPPLELERMGAAGPATDR